MTNLYIKWTMAAGRLRRFLVVLAIAPVLMVGLSAVVPAAAHAAAPSASNGSCSGTFFGLEPWYYYLGREMQGCDINCFNLLPQTVRNSCGQLESDVPLVLLAIVDDLLRIAGLVAVIFLIYAAINLITSQGNSEDAAKARNTAIYALVGLLFSMIAVVLVSFIGRSLGGS